MYLTVPPLSGADPGFREGGWLAVELLNFACEMRGSSEAERSFSCYAIWWLHTMSVYECSYIISLVIVLVFIDCVLLF